jgi:hypothetical protein
MSEELKKSTSLFDVEDDSTMGFLNPKTRNSDGIYRPSLEDAKDKRAGYKVTLRFLKNLKKDGTLGESAIEKHLHYVKLQNQPDLAGYYDCKKNLEKDCPLCSTYWSLSKSKNAADIEKSELLKRNTKYYSYVYIINDEEHPEHNGKVMVYSYGYKIREKINAQWKGEVDGKKCNVFDLANGKDFRLIIKENKTPEGTFPNYDSSQFLEKEPIKINGKAIPVEYSDEHKKNIITNPKVQKFLQEFLLKREHDLEEFEAKPWDDETTDKVNKLVSFITGGEIFSASSSVSGAASRESSKQPAASTASDDSFFDNNDGDQSVDDFFNVDEN